MSTNQTIGPINEFEPGTITSVNVAGEDLVVVCDKKGEISLFTDNCPHLDLPICNGKITDERLICPWHGASFDPNTGQTLSLPSVSDLQAVPFKIHKGELMAQAI